MYYRKKLKSKAGKKKCGMGNEEKRVLWESLNVGQRNKKEDRVEMRNRK